ncbi:hypothetical protein, partial [Pseudomonas syringae]|uniref:hypothetical protein n=1 Tax=Pseudomonas syringae TaxID=317 RepID=UPI001F4616CF
MSTKSVSDSITYRPDTARATTAYSQVGTPGHGIMDFAWFTNVIKSHPRVFPRILFNSKFDATTQAFYMQN